jgi:hypothetical protein
VTNVNFIPVMATWGVYFASYVKKNDLKEQKAEKGSERKEAFVIKPYKAEFSIGSSQVP